LVAGLALAERHETRLAIVDGVLGPWQGRDGTAELFDLFELCSVAIRIAPEESASTLGLRAARLRIASCNSDLNLLQRNLRRKLAELAEWAEVLRNPNPESLKRPIWSQLASGYDPRLEHLGAGKLIIGYFQTHRYLDATEQLPFLRSMAEREHSKRALPRVYLPTKRPYIALHVRRGDYRNNPQFGLLSRSYYENAIAALQASGVDIDDIYVFSDEIDTAAELLVGAFPDHRMTFISDRSLTAADTIQMMSGASSVITANSSLSYWAAMLSACPRKHIMYPDPWFRSHPTPDSLIPPSWTSVASTFAKSGA